MIRTLLVVTATLLTTTISAAQAAKNPGERSENARKAMILLGAIGVNSNDAKAFVNDIDSRVEDNTLNFTKERIGEGTLKFHYRLGNGISKDNFELQYAPDNSRWKAVARPDSAMIHYQYKF